MPPPPPRACPRRVTCKCETRPMGVSGRGMEAHYHVHRHRTRARGRAHAGRAAEHLREHGARASYALRLQEGWEPLAGRAMACGACGRRTRSGGGYGERRTPRRRRRRTAGWPTVPAELISGLVHLHADYLRQVGIWLQIFADLEPGCSGDSRTVRVIARAQGTAENGPRDRRAFKGSARSQVPAWEKG